MEYDRLDQMLDYHSLCDAQMEYIATGECDHDGWMRSISFDEYRCAICGCVMSADEYEERWPLPF